MIGKHLGHYHVLTRLGGGGMGDVYVELDTRLDRKVALKLPRPEVSASVDRLAMFRREARAAAALSHPNIVHLYAVEEVDGLTFMVMELVHGRTLRELLSDAVPLPLPRAISFTSQIAEALACAHAAGVLHRDLKPANVMVAEHDRVKILDFGVAKFFRSDPVWDSEAVTTSGEMSTSGTAVGTVGYMSPEQALGKTLDARTDLFALGVILFEMATGKAPFEGDTPAAIFDHLLNRRPLSPRWLNPALPSSVAAIIDKLLEKDPERRYRTAGECLEDLRRGDFAHGHAVSDVRAGSPGARPFSIVVLPFADMSPGRDQEYFCHGIAEEIIITLTRIPGLQVTSRTSAFAFQGKGLDITEIGRQLRVATALEGSVRKAGERVRVTAQLVDTESGHQLWSKRFDRELSDVFAIQDEIAATIASEFRMVMAGEPTWKQASLNVRAHEAYLRGLYARNKWSDSAMRQAIGCFDEAIGEDPAFAPAYAALAEGYVWLYSGVGVLPARDTIPQARSAVDKALQLDPTLADAHKVRALIVMNHDWDRRGAQEALTRALQIGPGSAAAHLWNAWRLVLLERRYDEALLELEEAARLDPLDLQVKTQIGYVHHFRHDAERAIAQFETVVTLEPSFAFAHYGLGDAFTHTGHYDRAIAEFNRAIELAGRSANHVGALGYAYGRSGNIRKAKEHLEELTARAADGYVSPMWMALVHAGVGDVDNLFDSLERAFEERDGSLILVTAALEFDSVRDDPRFKSLLERMGLVELASSRV